MSLINLQKSSKVELTDVFPWHIKDLYERIKAINKLSFHISVKHLSTSLTIEVISTD